jgi:hydrogenase nickel incorporation protein HypA/HybF
LRTHELSVCGSIYKIVDRAAAGRAVSVIHLQVGQLRQIVPDALKYCWTLVSDQTDLAGSELEVDSVPVTFLCAECSCLTTLDDDPLFLCHRCGGSHVSVTTGEECMLNSLELAEG